MSSNGRYQNFSHKGVFTRGDVVVIQQFPWNKFSPLDRETPGVILDAPEEGDSFPDYPVGIINRNGYFRHVHVREEGLRKAGIFDVSDPFLNLFIAHPSACWNTEKFPVAGLVTIEDLRQRAAMFHVELKED